jgi:hypothetical protein
MRSSLSRFRSNRLARQRHTLALALAVSILWLGCDEEDKTSEESAEAGDVVFEIDAYFPDLTDETDRDGGLPEIDATTMNDTGVDSDTADAEGQSDAESDALDSNDAEVDSDTDDAEVDSGPEVFDPGFSILTEVRTNVSHIGLINQGVDWLEIVSIFFRVRVGGSFNTITIHGEIENRDQEMRCIPLVDVSRLDDVDILMIADAAPHQSDVSDLTVACLPPGGRGVFRGIENEVSATILEDSQTFTYDISALKRDYSPHPATPILLSMQRERSNDGTRRVSGQLMSAATPIYNLGIDFYTKDERGLVVDDTSAYPHDLDTIGANTIVDYESYAFFWYTGEIAGLIQVMSFINGPAPPESSSIARTAGLPLSAEAARIQKARSNNELYHALRALSEVP